MATGRRAFSGKTQASLVGAIMHSKPEPVSKLVPLGPPAFDRLVDTCLAKDPEDRWGTAHDSSPARGTSGEAAEPVRVLDEARVEGRHAPALLPCGWERREYVKKA